MAKIKVNTVGVSSLKSRARNIKNKADDCVDIVSYVRKNIDMEVASSEDIASRLRSLQKRMQAQEDKMAKYAAFLDRVNDDFIAADRRIAKQAKNVQYLLNRIISLQDAFQTRQSIKDINSIQEVVKVASLFGIPVIGSALIPILIPQPTGHNNGANATAGSGKTKELKEEKSFWNKVAGWCEDAVDTAKDTASKVWNKTKEVAGKVGDAIKEDLKSDWNFIKTVATSKPMEYVWETGKSVLSFAGDVASFTKNVATFKWVGAATDLYQACSDIIDIGQDATALVLETSGALLGVFGADKAATAFSEAAVDYSSRDGLGGEFEAAGLDGVAEVFQNLDIAVSIYDLGTGLTKIDKALNGDTWKDAFALTGWKLDGDTGAMISNAKMVTKYIDGAMDADSFGDFITSTVGANTAIGKQVINTVKVPFDIADLVNN